MPARLQLTMGAEGSWPDWQPLQWMLYYVASPLCREENRGSVESNIPTVTACGGHREKPEDNIRTWRNYVGWVLF